MKNPIDRLAGVVLKDLAGKYPVVTLSGPRQSGKTTLCRMIFGDMPYANLEDPEIREFANSDANGFLNAFPDGAVIDEFQRVPGLASYIQVRVDEPGFNGVFVLTGSQNLSVRNVVSQSLAGRTALVTLLPFSCPEIVSSLEARSLDEIIFQGFYPRIHDKQLNPTQALADYVGTYVERDLRQVSMVKDLALFQKFLGLCAGRVGQLLNLQGLGNDVGVSQPTAREWLSLLEASYVAFRLPPFFRNISKRLIKSPKLYFYDVGLAAYLIGITSVDQLVNHPLRGMLYENLIVVEIMKFFLNGGVRPNLLFYRDSNRNEVDVVMQQGGLCVPVEIKSAATVTQDFFRGLTVFCDAVPEAGNPILVYAGSDVRTQQGFKIVNLRALDATLRELKAVVKNSKR
jgi:predicted AAA+ superfamily ATPase